MSEPQIFTPLEPLTIGDQQLILVALGALLGGTGVRNSDGEIKPAARTILETAAKFGATYDLPK